MASTISTSTPEATAPKRLTFRQRDLLQQVVIHIILHSRGDTHANPTGMDTFHIAQTTGRGL